MKWQYIWSYTQQDYRSWPSTIHPEVQAFEIVSNHKTQKLRLEFSNIYGVEPLHFEKVWLEVFHLDGRKTIHYVSVAGQNTYALGIGEECLSDPFSVDVTIGETIRIQTKTLMTCYLTSGTVTYSKQELFVENINHQGEVIKQENQFKMVQENPRMSIVYGVSGVLALSEEESVSIVAFGDSLTQQGFWVDALKTRLRQEGRHNVAVLNRGIGGNRVLSDTAPQEDGYYRHGQAGINRFEKDVFGKTIPDIVLVLHGINDFIHQQIYVSAAEVDPKEVIEGLKKYSAICHQYGSRAIIATLTPMKESIFYSEELEMNRQVVNTWIRQQSLFDGFLDFELCVKAEEDFSKLRSNFDSGDGLHLSLAGGIKIAEDLELSQLFGEK